MTFLLKIISQNSKYTASFVSIFKSVLLSPSMSKPNFWSCVRCWDPVGCSEELQEQLALRSSSTPESRGAAGIQRAWTEPADFVLPVWTSAPPFLPNPLSGDTLLNGSWMSLQSQEVPITVSICKYSTGDVFIKSIHYDDSISIKNITPNNL